MAGSDGGSAVAEIRGLLVEFDSRRDPRLLTAALERAETVLAAPGFAQLSGAVRAFVLTLAAGAATWRARTSEGRPEDLDHAISWTEQAIDAWPPEDPNRPRTQVNLATALVDRYEIDGDGDDLNRAVTVLEAAIPVMRAGGDRVDTALHSLGNAYHDRAGAEPRGAREDLDHAIALFREALDRPEPTSGERAGYLNSLGLSLRARARASGDLVLLLEAGETYRAARALAEPNGDTFAAATSNLAAVLQDRAEAENDERLLREAVQLYREVLPALDEQRRMQATTNLATALIDLYRYSRDREALDEASRDLRRSAATFPIGQRRQVAMANLAAALHEIYDHTGRIASLDEAIAAQDELLAPPAPRPPERTLNLGVSLLARFRRRRVLDDLDRAIEYLDRAVSVLDGALAPRSR